MVECLRSSTTPLTVNRRVSIEKLRPSTSSVPNILRANDSVSTALDVGTSAFFGSPCRRRKENRSKKVESANIRLAFRFTPFDSIGVPDHCPSTIGHTFSISG